MQNCLLSPCLLDFTPLCVKPFPQVTNNIVATVIIIIIVIFALFLIVAISGSGFIWEEGAHGALTSSCCIWNFPTPTSFAWFYVSDTLLVSNLSSFGKSVGVVFVFTVAGKCRHELLRFQNVCKYVTLGVSQLCHIKGSRQENNFLFFGKVFPNVADSQTRSKPLKKNKSPRKLPFLIRISPFVFPNLTNLNGWKIGFVFTIWCSL